VDLLNWLLNWLTTELPQLPASVQASLLQWLGSTLASWNTGGTPQTLPPPTDLAATPELSSLMLLGSGLLGAGGYALTRFRARRQS
jgi:hypothetical protein